MKTKLHAQILKITLITGLLLAASGCAIFEGTEAWCDLMEKKDKTDWTLNDAKVYGQECLLDD
jgi:hypothetical protein